jgi:hypothetical protein
MVTYVFSLAGYPAIFSTFYLAGYSDTRYKKKADYPFGASLMMRKYFELHVYQVKPSAALPILVRLSL